MDRKEAIKVIELNKGRLTNSMRIAVETLIPELTESEDERMRKNIIKALEILKSGSAICTIDTSEEIDWFKKQKEQKPVEWNEEDEDILNSLIRLYDKEYSKDKWPWSSGRHTFGDVVRFLKSLRPQPHWKPSEEQMKALQNAVALTGWGNDLESLYNDLKKL